MMGISTHTPLAGRNDEVCGVDGWQNISTHTPLAGRNAFSGLAYLFKGQFLLTRPSRGATNYFLDWYASKPISTHTPLAGRNDEVCGVDGWQNISTHTPLAGRNAFSGLAYLFKGQFLLTRPSRGATNYFLDWYASKPISTHTPLAGRNLWSYSSH